jgi:hypothetical protein
MRACFLFIYYYYFFKIWPFWPIFRPFRPILVYFGPFPGACYLRLCACVRFSVFVCCVLCVWLATRVCVCDFQCQEHQRQKRPISANFGPFRPPGDSCLCAAASKHHLRRRIADTPDSTIQRRQWSHEAQLARTSHAKTRRTHGTAQLCCCCARC